MSTRTPKANGKPSAKPKPKPPAVPPQPDEDHGPILDLIARIVPNAEAWLRTPNRDLAGNTPEELVGGPHEEIVRGMVLAYKYGTFS